MKTPRKIDPETFLKVNNGNHEVYHVSEVFSKQGILLKNLFNPEDEKTTTLYDLKNSVVHYRSVSIVTKSKDGNYITLDTEILLDGLLKMTDLKTAMDFHLQNNYPGKTSKITKEGTNGALNLALEKEYLKIIEDNLNPIKNKQKRLLI